ncbi:hypothetical protein RUND412_008366 [Rhizina undulata]
MSSPPPLVPVAQPAPLPPSQRASYPSNIPVAFTPTPLLLKRLQQQKKRLAESSKRHHTIAGTSRTIQWSNTANNEATPDRSSSQSSNSRPGPSMKATTSGGRRSDVNRRIEGMGAREMDQLREKIVKTENELLENQNRLSEAQARTDEVTGINEKLQMELESRDVALSDAVRIILTYEEHVAELEQFLQQQVVEDRGERLKEEAGDKPDVKETTNDATLRPRDLRSLAVSPFAHRSASAPMLTPLRPRPFPPERTQFSPISNLIDPTTPQISAARMGSSFLKAAFLSDEVLSPPLSGPSNDSHPVLESYSSIPNDDPSPDPPPASPVPSVLDSPRLSVLSESSFASMYGGHEAEGSDTYEEDGPESFGRIGMLDTPLSLKIKFYDQFRGAAQTPNPDERSIPRKQMMEYIDRAKERQIAGLAIINAVLPPTPESISTTKIGSFKDDDFHAAEAMNYSNPNSVTNEEFDELSKVGVGKESGGVKIQPLPRNRLESTPLGKFAPNSNRTDAIARGNFNTDSGNISNRKEIFVAKNTRNPKPGDGMTLRRRLGFGERIAVRGEKEQEKKTTPVGGKKPIGDNARQKRNSSINLAGAKKFGSTMINTDTPPHTPTSDVTVRSSTLSSKRASWESFSERSLLDQLKHVDGAESEKSIGSRGFGTTASNTSSAEKTSESGLPHDSGKRMATTSRNTTLRRSSSFAESKRMDNKGQKDLSNKTIRQKRERQSLATKLGKGEWRF